MEWSGFFKKSTIILMYLLTNSWAIYDAFFGAIIKWVDISLPPQRATRSTIWQELWTYTYFLLSWNVQYEKMTWLRIYYDQFL